MRVLYLHGFASSAASSKATFLARKLSAHDVTLETPDLNQPDFSTLTISRMVSQTVALISAGAAGPVVLIGSSMGAFVAIQVALKLARGEDAGVGRLKPASTDVGVGRLKPSSTDAGVGRLKPASTVDRLVLLAPALDFSRDPAVRFGDRDLAEWKRTGRTNVFHYGYGRMLPLEYGLYADACSYDCIQAHLTMPILVFQGIHDTVVDPATVENWASQRRNVELFMLDDDHQLGASLDRIWHELRRFLCL